MNSVDQMLQEKYNGMETKNLKEIIEFSKVNKISDKTFEIISQIIIDRGESVPDVVKFPMSFIEEPIKIPNSGKKDITFYKKWGVYGNEMPQIKGILELTSKGIEFQITNPCWSSHKKDDVIKILWNDLGEIDLKLFEKSDGKILKANFGEISGFEIWYLDFSKLNGHMNATSTIKQVLKNLPEECTNIKCKNCGGYVNNENICLDCNQDQTESIIDEGKSYLIKGGFGFGVIVLFFIYIANTQANPSRLTLVILCIILLAAIKSFRRGFKTVSDKKRHPQ